MVIRMYENYVFDLYGTLVDIHTDEDMPEVWEKLALFYGYYGALYEPQELQDSYEKLVKIREQGQKTQLEAGGKSDVQPGANMVPNYTHEAYPEIKIEQVFMELFEQKGITAERTLGIHTGQFFRVLTTDYIKLYKGVPAMLENIRRMGKKVFLLSNAQRIFTEYELNLLDIAKYFDGILISSEYGTKKPDIRFFEILLKQYQLNPRECIMIGNDARCDIAGAKNAGMDTYYIHSNISPECTSEPDATYCQMKMDITKVCRALAIPM